MQYGFMRRFFLATVTLCAAAVLAATSGCSNSSAGANMSVDDYKKAAMGSKMSPEADAAMRVAVKKNIADAAARAAAAQHGPPTAPGASK